LGIADASNALVKLGGVNEPLANGSFGVSAAATTIPLESPPGNTSELPEASDAAMVTVAPRVSRSLCDVSRFGTCRTPADDPTAGNCQ
jgi:hypothetical protein